MTGSGYNLERKVKVKTDIHEACYVQNTLKIPGPARTGATLGRNKEHNQKETLSP